MEQKFHAFSSIRQSVVRLMPGSAPHGFGCHRFSNTIRTISRSMRGQRLGEVERRGGRPPYPRRRAQGKAPPAGRGRNVRQPDLCIRAQFRQPFHHAVELQIVLRPRILAQQRKRIRVDAAPLPPAGVYRMAVQIQAERGFHLRGLGVQGGKAEGKAKTGG